MPLVGYLDLVMNDVKQRLLKFLKTKNRLKGTTLIRIKKRTFKSLIT
jgi:hypothetical protein